MILHIEQGKNNPILRAQSHRVDIFDDELRQFIQNMRETLANVKNGVGLAAPQVGRNIRLFVISPDFAGGAEDHLVYVNPVVVRKSWWRKEKLQEGCLSLPDKWAELKRPQKAILEAQDEYGRRFKIKSQGLLARLYLHEVDHLNGILYIDHLR